MRFCCMEEPGAIKDSFVLRKGEETVGGLFRRTRSSIENGLAGVAEVWKAMTK